MANIGEQLLQPEHGWKRYNEIDVRILKEPTATGQYSGVVMNESLYEGSSYQLLNGTIRFYVNTKKIRIIGFRSVYSYTNNAEIYVDGIKIGSFSNVGNSAMYQCLLYDGELGNGTHEVVVSNNTGLYMNLDCIDIDEDGYMLYCDDNGKLYYDVTPIMTSNTTPAPYVASASSEFTSNHQAYKAFNGSLLLDYDTFAPNEKTGWITLNFDETKKINSFLIGTAKNEHFSSEAYPKNFELYGSNDNLDYTLINEFKDIEGWTAESCKIFNLNKTTKNQYYQLNISKIGNATWANITELRYLLAVDTPFYLIQDNIDNKIYNYDEENNQLVEVLDTSILKEDALNNICIYNLNKVMPLLDTLSDDLTILCNNDKKIIANGIKSNKELIIGKNSFSTKIAKNIDYFQLDENATAKIIFSIDDGATWKTYNSSTNTFEDLSISIPVNKDYSDFTEEEKIAWEEAKEIAYNQGINSSILNTIDFNNLNAEKIRFGYILTITDAETMDRMTNLIWKFDSKGVMEVIDSDKVKQQLYYGGVKLISNIDADMLKVNITYEGITGELPR